MPVETANLLHIEEYHPLPASDLPILKSLLLKRLKEVKVALATLVLGSITQLLNKHGLTPETQGRIDF